jgi:hypothetical protein
MGHEDQFAPPGPSGRYRFGQATFTGTHGNERDAPIPAIREASWNRKVLPMLPFAAYETSTRPRPKSDVARMRENKVSVRRGW